MKTKKKARAYKSEIINNILSEVSPLEAYQIERRLLIAAKIDDALQTKGWGKKQFADSLGKQSSEITKWLSGSHNFTINTLAEIEYVLGTNLLVLAKR